MSPPLLIHTEASHGWGGQEMRTLAECRWFREKGYRVELIARPEAVITREARQKNFTVHERPLSKKSQLKDFAFCKRLFGREKPLMVGTHSNIDSRVCLAAATLAGVPHRFRYRHVSIPVKSNPWNRLIYRKLATRVITTAESIAIPLRKNFHLPPGRVISIPTGVNQPDDLPGREEARINLCRELKIPETSRFVGQVSVLRRWKGHYDVMEAFNRVHTEAPEYHLVFTGGGHGMEAFPKKAAEYPCGEKIHFLGHRENPWLSFLAMDIATLASTEGEGIPQSGMQAMLCGCAFIGTTIGGIPEIIKDGQTGLLVPPESPSSLALSLSELMTNRETRERLAGNARAWALENTSLDQMGELITALMD